MGVGLHEAASLVPRIDKTLLHSSIQLNHWKKSSPPMSEKCDNLVRNRP